MNTPSNETIAQVKFRQMMRLLKSSLIVCRSQPPNDEYPDALRYSVNASFPDLRTAQDFHRMLIELWTTANE